MTMNVDGLNAIELAARIGAPRIALFTAVSSTMDEAHRLAERGAPDATIVVADTQTAGRGRFGRRWTSELGAGLWMTMILRSVPQSGLDVLSIRIGLALAPELDRFADGRVWLKWPNDLLVANRKLAGILVEARWRDTRVEWVAVGVGVNLIAPASERNATGLRAGVLRRELLGALYPAIISACASTGDLSRDELIAYAERDSARDARLSEPAAGVARGITVDGALIVETATGRELFRRGSLVHALENS